MKFDVKLQCGETIEIHFNDDFEKSTAFKHGPRGKIIVPVIEKLVIKGQEISYKDNVNAHLNYDFFNDDEIGFHVSFNNQYTIEKIVNLLEIEWSDKHRLNMKLPGIIESETSLMVTKRRIAHEEKIQECLIDTVEAKPNILLKYNTSYKYSLEFKGMPEETYLLRDYYIKEQLDILNSKYNNDNRESLKEYISDTDWGDYSITEYYDIPYCRFINYLADIENIVKAKEEEVRAKKLKTMAENKEKYCKAWQEARRIKAPVEFARCMVECDDPNEECSLDCIISYVNPDGKTEETRHHTW